MKTIINQIKELVFHTFKDMGCQKVGARWCRSQNGVGMTLALYKLREHQQFRIEISIETREEFQAECRRIDEGSILLDADDLRVLAGKADIQSFEDLLNFEIEMPDDLRASALKQALEDILVPGLEKATNRNFLRSPEASLLLRNVLVRLDANI